MLTDETLPQKRLYLTLSTSCHGENYPVGQSRSPNATSVIQEISPKILPRHPLALSSIYHPTKFRLHPIIRVGRI